MLIINKVVNDKKNYYYLQDFRFLPVLLCLAYLVLITGCATVVKPWKIEKIRTITGFKAPESVVYDKKRELFYVSNVNGELSVKDGNGFISQVNLAGDIITTKWATGLDAPKGLALYDDHLYITDIDRLVIIDCNSGKIVKTYQAKGAEFLNDITIDNAGIVYMSGFFTNRIYIMKDSKLSIFFETPELENPNGVLINGDELLVACWGVMKPDFSTKVPGKLKKINIKTKKMYEITSTAIGNLDGIKLTTQGDYLLTDWMEGGLLEVRKNGTVTHLLDLPQGSADHEYIPEKELVIIPMLNDNTVLLYRLYK